MSTWVTVPCLLALREEFNDINPKRDKGADGTIGDSAHTSSSDHTPDEDSDVLRDHDADSKNEVHALDIDSSGPWSGETFAALVFRVIAGERAKWLSATDRCRLKYVIFNRKIYSQTTDFEPRDYTGSDPHTNHAHFSARYETSCENDTRSFGVAKKVAPPPPPVKEWDEMATEAEVKQAFRDVLAERRPYFLTRIGDRGWSNLSVDGKLDYIFEALVAGGNVDLNDDGLPNESGSLQAALADIREELAQLRAAVAAPPAS